MLKQSLHALANCNKYIQIMEKTLYSSPRCCCLDQVHMVLTGNSELKSNVINHTMPSG